MLAENVIKSKISRALKSVEDRTCIKFIKVSNLPLLNTSVPERFGVVFSSHGNRYVICNVKCLREKFKLSRDH